MSDEKKENVGAFMKNDDFEKFAEKATEVFPYEIDIKIRKNGNVIVALDGTPIGMLQQLLLFVDAKTMIPVIHMRQARVAEKVLDGKVSGHFVDHDHYTFGPHTIGLDGISDAELVGGQTDDN